MISFGTQPIFVLFLTQIVNKNDIEIDVAFVNWLFDAICYTIIFAMLWMRKRATKPIPIATLSFDIVLSIADYFVKQGFNVEFDLFGDLIIGVLFNALLILYFAVSRRVKYALTRPLHTSDSVVEVKKDVFFNWKSWPFWRDLVIIFCRIWSCWSLDGNWILYINKNGYISRNGRPKQLIMARLFHTIPNL